MYRILKNSGRPCFVSHLPDCVGVTGDVYLHADDTTLSVIGESVDEVFAALNTLCYSGA